MRTAFQRRSFDSRGKGSADQVGAGGKLRTREIRQILTISGAAASFTLTDFIPALVWCWGVVVEVISSISGGTGWADMDIGDGTDVDRWGAGIALVEGTITNSDDFTAATSMGFFTTAAVDVVFQDDGILTAAQGQIRVVALINDITGQFRRKGF